MGSNCCYGSRHAATVQHLLWKGSREGIGWLRFRRETGREVTQMGADALSDMAVYLWCCVRSACQVDGVAFDMDLLDDLPRLARARRPDALERAGGR